MKKSLIFLFLKCCVDMSQRPDKLIAGRESATGSARAERSHISLLRLNLVDGNRGYQDW